MPLRSFQVGTIAGVLAYDHFKYKPLVARRKRELEAVNRVLKLITLMAKLDGLKSKGKDGLILSPFQIKRFGQDN